MRWISIWMHYIHNYVSHINCCGDWCQTGLFAVSLCRQYDSHPYWLHHWKCVCKFVPSYICLRAISDPCYVICLLIFNYIGKSLNKIITELRTFSKCVNLIATLLPSIAYCIIDRSWHDFTTCHFTSTQHILNKSVRLACLQTGANLYSWSLDCKNIFLRNGVAVTLWMLRPSSWPKTIWYSVYI